jgi:hypothetical protein
MGKACHFRQVNKASYINKLILFRMVRCELSPQTRLRICELSTFGLLPNRILKLYPELNLSIIKLIIRREASYINNASKSRSGRPRALTEEQWDHVYDIINHTNPYIKMRDLLREVDDIIKKRLLQGLLREIGKRKWIQKKRPIITIAYTQARLNWAIRHQAYILHDWIKVSWSDEYTVKRDVGVKTHMDFYTPRRPNTSKRRITCPLH